jgi:hypothetical protein
MNADWFLLLVATTTALRGLGAGSILGVVLITLPTRRRLGILPYARFTRALYRGPGVPAYGGLTVLGALLTVIALAAGLAGRASPVVTWWIAASLAATMLGFVGTARALPTMTLLWGAPDEDESLLATLLARFARWGTFSAGWHVLAFFSLVAAMAVGARMAP